MPAAFYEAARVRGSRLEQGRGKPALAKRTYGADDNIIRNLLASYYTKGAFFLSALSAAGVLVASVHVGTSKSQDAVLRAVKGVLGKHLGNGADGSMIKFGLIGPPSAGKGTVTQSLQDFTAVLHVSTRYFLCEFFLNSVRLSRVSSGSFGASLVILPVFYLQLRTD